MARLDIEDLRALGAASRAVLGSVARDARDQARSLADRHRERKNQGPPERREADRVTTPRRRFKRRWIVVPVLVLLLVAVLVIGGVTFLLGRALGLF